MNENDWNTNNHESEDSQKSDFDSFDSEKNREEVASAEPEKSTADSNPTEEIKESSYSNTEQQQDKPDENQQNPYQQQYNQWQQGNYYGQQPNYNPYQNYNQTNNNNPYGQNNPYQQYSPYGQNPQPQYQSYQPNGQQVDPENPPPKKNKGVKIFLISVGILIAVFVICFTAYGIYEAYNQRMAPRNNEVEITSELPQDENNSSAQTEKQKPVPNDGGNGLNANGSGLVIEKLPQTASLTAKEIYKKVAPSVVGVIAFAGSSQTPVSQGSGIVASPDGYIITNSHVINNSKDFIIKVVLNNNKEYMGTVVGFDKTTDLAIIKINAKDLITAKFGDVTDLSVGDEVLAIGNPGGIEYSSSLTGGYVSALDRKVGANSANGMTYIQTDAAINPGNSGGALINMYGQVVGINSSKIVEKGYEGMGFAIPVSKAKTILDALMTKGYVKGRTRLGITASTVSDMQAEVYKLPRGVIVATIDHESGLYGTGVVPGDIITKADGKDIASMEELFAMLNTHKPNETITLTIYRVGDEGSQGKTFTVKAKLLEDKGETQRSTSSSPIK